MGMWQSLSQKLPNGILLELINACKNSNFKIFQDIMLDNKFNININNKYIDNDDTFLMRACLNSNVQMVNFIIIEFKNNILINITNKNGYSALKYACKQNNLKIVKLLINNFNYIIDIECVEDCINVTTNLKIIELLLCYCFKIKKLIT